MAKNTKARTRRAPLDGIESIRRLMIMQLIAQGISAETIAEALECENSRISQIIPVNAVKKQSRQSRQ
jgi:DNA-binding NarL/FixJ family response regulator